MKRFFQSSIAILLYINLYAQAPISKQFNVQLKKTNTAIIDISNETINKLESIGFKYTNNYAYLSRNYSEHFDFNKDGFKDLIWVFSKDPSIGSPITVLLWDQSKKRFIEKSEYFILGHGDHMFYYDTVDDFDDDGDLDIYFPMENYHGENGKQPSYYLKNDFNMPGNYLKNTGNGFERIYIDTAKNNYGNGPVYPNYTNASLIYYDEDNKKDLIVPSINQHPLNKGFLATKYTIKSNGQIERQFVFPWQSSEMYRGQAHSMSFKNFNNKIYAFVQPKEDYPDGINTFYYYTYPEIWIYDKSKNNQAPSLIRKFELKRNKSILDAGQILNHDTFYITDLDKDGNEEIIIGMFTLPQTSKHFSVHVFDNTGKEVTDKWFSKEEFVDATGANGNGFDVIDLNNDGYDDILFRDRFNSANEDLSILLNTGKIFEQHIIKTNSFDGFNMAVDVDKNGISEIMRVGYKTKDINESVVSFELQINNCAKSTKPVFNTNNYSLCSGDSLKLSITNTIKGDTLKWFFGKTSDINNVTNKIFTDSTKLYVTKTDSIGCTVSSDTIQIIKYPTPPSPSIIRDTENFLVSNLNNITWYKDGIKIADTTQKIKPAANGLYSATTTQNGCTSKLSQGYYYFVNSISNLTNGEYFKISPNPTKGDLKIDYKLNANSNLFISINNANGIRIITNQEIRPGDIIKLNKVISGSYFLVAKDKNGRLITSRKILKE
jgi:hypothetical protein